jgi:hypothetical protein
MNTMGGNETKIERMRLEILKARLEIAKEFSTGSFASVAWVLEHIMGFSRGEAEWLSKQN